MTTVPSGVVPSVAVRPPVARIILILALLGASAAHLPAIPEHLAAAPYMGVLFVIFSATCVLLAAALISLDNRLLRRLSALACGAAIGAYLSTRLVAFPMLADDRGNWLEPLGVVSVSVEAIAVLAAHLGHGAGWSRDSGDGSIRPSGSRPPKR